MLSWWNILERGEILGQKVHHFHLHLEGHSRDKQLARTLCPRGCQLGNPGRGDMTSGERAGRTGLGKREPAVGGREGRKLSGRTVLSVVVSLSQARSLRADTRTGI